jgi:ech hydrogenase subunit D
MDGPAFLERVRAYHDGGHRLVLINATALRAAPDVVEGTCDLSWTFEKDDRLEHLRERVAPGGAVPSVTGIYLFAYLYENELAELFGVNVTGISVDFKGELYRTATKVPFSAKAIRERLEAGKARQP